MTEFWLAIEWFVYGFVGGLVAHPAWSLAKRIWHEAKLAREQWGNPSTSTRKDYE